MEIINYFKVFIIGVFFTLIIFLIREIIKDKKSINKVHFYVARDKDSNIFLYLGKPERHNSSFYSCNCGKIIAEESSFQNFNLKVENFKDLKWEDEPVEVFLNLED